MGVPVKNEKPERRSTLRLLLLVAGIILLTTNLRAPITSVGPVVPLIRDGLGISNTMVGALTTIPLLAFGLLSPFAPRLARRFGMEFVLFFVLIAITFGLIARPLGGISILYIGTIFIGAGIAIANVLMPAFIKMKFENNIGVMTGIYSISMNITAALAAGLSIPIATASSFGWKASIGVWAIFAVIALLVWIPQLRNQQKASSQGNENHKGNSLLRSKLAWKITIFMGLQSLLFFCIAAWFPVILQDRGMTAEKAGWMLSSVQLAQLPFTFIVPIIAGRMKNQIPLVWVTFITLILGLSGILSGSMALVLPSAILFGIATAFAFGLAMMFFMLRTENIFEAAGLSAMAQTFGYLLAATGPALFGLLYDLTGGWTIPIFLLVFSSIVLLIVGLGAGKDNYVSKPPQTTTEK
ncbi:MFS transporter [Sporosarcina pasteurii]|uniref:Inner membrane transport protein YeaN n=1 Tax=Sporosarcina pasteurii TaxID=1474 RepID=A0A380C710_SPOPA|nr:MFS transporter [Sporosarcina pasteurii]MDS9473065.1 MFS transporter [Sporosarcina pasteurii]QBQ04571.1 MFS transporter [Sporosarcina pasteurii]SUJ14160.1 Inner membrane transport protein YeaN [Sporosarcina pasteurii]